MLIRRDALSPFKLTKFTEDDVEDGLDVMKFHWYPSFIKLRLNTCFFKMPLQRVVFLLSSMEVLAVQTKETKNQFLQRQTLLSIGKESL